MSVKYIEPEEFREDLVSFFEDTVLEAQINDELDISDDDREELAETYADVMINRLQKYHIIISEDDIDDYFYEQAEQLFDECADVPDNWKMYIDYQHFAEDLQINATIEVIYIAGNPYYVEEK